MSALFHVSRPTVNLVKMLPLMLVLEMPKAFAYHHISIVLKPIQAHSTSRWMEHGIHDTYNFSSSREQHFSSWDSRFRECACENDVVLVNGKYIDTSVVTPSQIQDGKRTMIVVVTSKASPRLSAIHSIHPEKCVSLYFNHYFLLYGFSTYFMPFRFFLYFNVVTKISINSQQKKLQYSNKSIE